MLERSQAELASNGSIQYGSEDGLVVLDANDRYEGYGHQKKRDRCNENQGPDCL